MKTQFMERESVVDLVPQILHLKKILVPIDFSSPSMHGCRCDRWGHPYTVPPINSTNNKRRAPQFYWQNKEVTRIGYQMVFAVIAMPALLEGYSIGPRSYGQINFAH